MYGKDTYCPPYLFNLYAERIMRMAGLDESTVGVGYDSGKNGE